MKICYVVSQYPAVSHTFIRREIHELERNGFEIFRVSVRGDDLPLVDPADIRERQKTRYLVREGVPSILWAFTLAVGRSPIRFWRAAAKATRMMRRSARPRVFHLAYLMEACLLAKWLKEHQFGHIHAHFGTNSAEVAMLAHFLTGIPYSFTVHGPEEFDKPEFLGLAQKVQHASFVCAVSSFGRSQICRWIPFEDWRKVHVVRCGLDQEFKGLAPKDVPAADRLVCIGRLSEQKGHFLLLDALAMLAKRNITFKVTLVGDGPLRSRLVTRIEELGLSGSVELTGWVSNAEIRRAILGARAVMLPSFAEGLPVSIMEAFALGRPVISTYFAGIPELVVNGENGWLVPPGNTKDLAGAIEECLAASEEQIIAMGARGRMRVLQMHDIAHECAIIAALFRAVISVNGGVEAVRRSGTRQLATGAQ